MRKIRIGFSRPHHFKLGAFAISKYIHRNFSHVLMYWDSTSLGETLVYQASLGMVHFCNMDRFILHNELIMSYEISVTDEQFNALIKKCIELAGIEYSTKELLGILLNNLLNKDVVGDQPGFICSELIAEFLQDIASGEFKKAPHLIDPSDIADFLERNIGGSICRV